MSFNKGNFPSVSQNPRSLSKPLHNFRDYLKGKGKAPLTQRPPPTGTGAEEGALGHGGGGDTKGQERRAGNPRRKGAVFVSFKLTTNYLINMFQLQPVERRLWTARRESTIASQPRTITSQLFLPSPHSSSLLGKEGRGGKRE